MDNSWANRAHRAIKGVIGEMGKYSKLAKQIFCQDTCGVPCRNDYYNGKNDKGVDECWGLEKARLVEREIYPWSDSSERKWVITLSCYRPDRQLKPCQRCGTRLAWHRRGTLYCPNAECCFPYAEQEVADG